jgi:hypothetical protein
MQIDLIKANKIILTTFSQQVFEMLKRVRIVGKGNPELQQKGVFELICKKWEKMVQTDISCLSLSHGIHQRKFWILEISPAKSLIFFIQG